jgi:hypothetical protein
MLDNFKTDTADHHPGTLTVAPRAHYQQFRVDGWRSAVKEGGARVSLNYDPVGTRDVHPLLGNDGADHFWSY